MISNEQIQRFKTLDMQAIEGIADENLRQQALKLRNKQGGFTLLELLVVVAILAVLGGLAIGAYGDKTTQAARGGATNTIAAVDSMVRAFQASAKVLPNELDTLVCATPAAGTLVEADARVYGGDSDLPGVGGGIGAKMKGKLNLVAVPNIMLSALNNAGINEFRYGLHGATDSSCDTTSGAAIAAPAAVADIDFGAGVGNAAPGNYPNGSLAEADIPQRGFDFPVAGGTNRGRGFEKYTVDPATGTMQAAATLASIPLTTWKPGNNGANNIKVGAKANDVLVVLGLGNNASMITDTTGNRVAASAPFYGDVGKDKYNRYMALIKVGTATLAGDSWTTAALAAGTAASKAAFITVVDPRGDFLDEEYAEANGQKS